MEIITQLENKNEEFNQLQSMVIDIDTVQPLIDLGYITFEECHPDNREQLQFLEQAVRQFRKDYEVHQLLKQRFTFLPFEKEHYHSYAQKLNEIEQSFIQSLVSFEGAFLISNLPKFGTVSLASRIVHYRLKILGLYGKKNTEGIDAPFTNESLEGLKKITAFFDWEITDLDFINVVGNIEILIDNIYRKLDAGDIHKKFIYMDKNGIFDTTKIISQSSEAVAQYYEFLARIFQIRLWMNGLYHGEIDGIIKNNDANKYSTKRAIKELVKYLRRDEKLRNDPIILQKNINLKRLKVQDFYDKSQALKAFWLNVVDLLYVTKSMQDEEPVVAVSDILIDDKNEALKKRIFEKEGELKAEVKLELKERIVDFLEGKKRRIYYGIQKFASTIRRVIRNIIRFVRNKVRLGFNFIRRIAILVYKEVKEGIKVFIHGMKFLLGKRQILTSKKTNRADNEVPEDTIVSKFDLDCDSIIFISDKSDPVSQNRHNSKCRNQVNSLNISLVLAAFILRWVLLLTSGSIAWTPFLLMIARTLKQIKKTKIGKHLNRVIMVVS